MTLRRIVLVSVVGAAITVGCSFEQVLEAPAADAGPDATSAPGALDATTADAATPVPDGASSAPGAVCSAQVRGTAQSPSLDTELVVAWERIDGDYVVVPANVAFTADRRAFVLDPGQAAPPAEAHVSPTTAVAIGRVYGVRAGAGLSGKVDQARFLATITDGTYRDALIWSRDAMTGSADGPWSTRLPQGYSAWRCSSEKKKERAFVGSTCDAFVLESGGEPGGDRHCDWH